MNVATSLNRKYINYTIVMLTSVCENNPIHIEAYILHSELSDEDIQYMQMCLSKYDINLNPIKIKPEFFKDNDFPVTEDWSIEAYYRLLLVDFLPQSVERLLYFDVDLIINKPINDLYTMDFDGNEVIACPDLCGWFPWESRSPKQKHMLAPMIESQKPYFNSGMLLLNIGQMRGKYNYDVYLQAMKEWDFEMTCPDQDILNYVHWEKTKYVDPFKYDLFHNVAYSSNMTYETVKKNTSIMHFAGPKPWNTRMLHRETEKLWWDYAALTHKKCYETLISEFMQDIFEDKTLLIEDDKIHSLYEQALNELEEAREELQKAKIAYQQMEAINQKLIALLKEN